VLTENLQRGIIEELYREEIDIDVLVKMRLETMMMPFNQLVFPQNKYKLVEIETELTTHFLFGLATSKGYKLISKYQKDSTKNTNTNEKILA
jgi:TetR/AcrR family transcriptional regulator, cholesterol catabolism regulator